MNKRVVAILFGGVSSEHEVSRMSATSVLKNIDREAFDPVMVGITKDGRWLRYTGPVEQIVTGEWEQHPDNRPCILSPDRSVHGLVLFGDQGAETVRLDAVFPVMHGRNAEDGSMQGLCELSGVPYVGPGVTASALCMDKEYTHIVLAASGVPTTDWVCVHRDAVPSLLDLEVKIAVKLGGFPVFVKPCNAGSSVGVSKVRSSDELEAAMALAFVASYIKVFSLPYGGSVTLFSMLFICLIGYWYGVGPGIMTGLAYGILQFLQEPYVLSLFQVCCDYVLAFAGLGLAGLFHKSKNGLVKGYILGILVRGAFHALGGYLYWMDYMPENFPQSLAALYPIIYNYSYILAEGVLTVIVISLPPVSKALAQVKRNALS